MYTHVGRKGLKNKREQGYLSWQIDGTTEREQRIPQQQTSTPSWTWEEKYQELYVCVMLCRKKKWEGRSNIYMRWEKHVIILGTNKDRILVLRNDV